MAGISCNGSSKTNFMSCQKLFFDYFDLFKTMFLFNINEKYCEYALKAHSCCIRAAYKLNNEIRHQPSHISNSIDI